LKKIADTNNATLQNKLLCSHRQGKVIRWLYEQKKIGKLRED